MAATASDGGTIPTGFAFAITRIDYAGGARGDSNGNGAFRIVVNDQEIVGVQTTDAPIAGTWTGRLVVQGGRETDSYFEIANSSWGEVTLQGEFVAGAAARGFGGRNAGFGRVPPRAVVRDAVLTVPEVRLQIRTSNVGGNPSRIDLRGRRGLYVTRLASEPLDFTAPLAEPEWCVAFAKGGGALPPGTTFVVTKVRWSGATGDGQGTPLRVVVAGKELVVAKAANETVAGEWVGELEVPAEEETRTFVEVGNGSHADVVISGRLEPR